MPRSPSASTPGLRRKLSLHIVESREPLDRVATDLEAAVTRNKFGVLGVHDLKETMAKKGVTFARECRIFEVCNPHQAKKVLETNLEISTALPCRISVYEEGGITKLATIKPTAMIALYANPELRGVAEDVEATLNQIMAEAARYATLKECSKGTTARLRVLLASIRRMLASGCGGGRATVHFLRDGTIREASG